MKTYKYHISKVDPTIVGKILVNSIFTAKIVGHKNPKRTLIDYYHPEIDNIPGQFVKDYILLCDHKLTLEKFIDKWIPDFDLDTMRKFKENDPLARKQAKNSKGHRDN